MMELNHVTVNAAAAESDPTPKTIMIGIRIGKALVIDLAARRTWLPLAATRLKFAIN
jgi:hypothetical protein